MMSTDHTSKKQNNNQIKSGLEKLQLFYEHTDDTRNLVHRDKQVKHATKSVAARR